MYLRRLGLELAAKETCFLWGARQTGKSTLLKTLFPHARRYDLLLSREYRRLASNPDILGEELAAEGITGATQRDPVIIDEIQKAPGLLDEVHWLAENRGIRFILCGSSARKLRRGHANLLGGRAVRYHLHPLTSAEIPEFSLAQALDRGLIPRHYDSPDAERLMQGYVDDYLKEEVAAEALTRNIPAFGRFLEIAALSNGQPVNFTNVARECGVSSPTVREYFQILEDTLMGTLLPAFEKRGRRRIRQAPRFYFFDIAPVRHLTRRGPVVPRSESYGRAFEHFLWMELAAHAHYSGSFHPLSYWRTASGLEVDFVLGDGAIAVEAKASEQVRSEHLTALRAFRDEHGSRASIVVSLVPAPRRTDDGIDILPVHVFLQRLWGGDLAI